MPSTMHDAQGSQDVLIHWTGRVGSDADAFAVLQSICAERLLRMTYCPTYVRDNLKPSVSMACFTDIALAGSALHCRRFGRCGIAFKKEALIRYGANPVFYTTGRHFDRIVALAKLLDTMLDREKDREWAEDAEPYSFDEPQTLALLEALSFLQEYEYKGNVVGAAINYSQREWRLTFLTLPFAGGNQGQAPGMSGCYVRSGARYRTVAFAASDVSFIVVPRAYQPDAASLAAQIGCHVRVYEEHVEVVEDGDRASET